MCPGTSQVDTLPCLQNQPKPVTFETESACGASAKGALGGSQSGLEHAHPDTGGAIPAKIQFNRIPGPDFAGMVCQHCFMDVGRDFVTFFEYLEEIVLYCYKKNNNLKAYRLKQAPLAER